MSLPGPRLTAALGVLLTAATGIITNLITNRWSPTLAAALAALLLAGVLLAVRVVAPGQTGRTRVRDTVRGGSMRDSSVTASNSADVQQTARRGGKIHRTDVTVDGADYRADADQNGDITDITRDIR